MSSAKSTKRTSKATVVGVKRAAIYVRVSSERQSKTKGSDGKEAEKESPQAQERDCRALAEKQGYVIVAVYRDVEKYRVGKRLVEPSGTRADRPQLRAMLADARKGDFDVILAWREDRLYRGYRPMLDVLDCLEETGLDIELAKEHFDKAIAPVKAWAARMELQAKHDRQMMGMAGRLAQGKAWSNIAPYGYQVVDGFFVEDGNESQWIRLMWQMFGDGESVGEIRRRLIASGARQRKDTKYPWGRHIIYQIFWCDYYYTGLYRVEWDSKNYILPMPVIVDADVAARVKGRLAQWKAYPAGNLKATTLVAGLAYCEKCGAKMAVRELQNGKNHRYSYYRCNTFGRNNTVPGCAKSVRIYRIDDDVWGKLWKLISVPGELEAAIEKRVTELQAQEFDATAECEKMQKKLDDLAMMRQEAIALFQSKIISEADLKLRLTSLGFEQTEAEHKLRDNSLLVGNQAERLMAVAQAYREGAVSGAVDVTQEPKTPEEAARLFQFKRKMVEGLVKRVDVKADKSTVVTFELDFSGAALPDDCISVTRSAHKENGFHARSVALLLSDLVNQCQ